GCCCACGTARWLAGRLGWTAPRPGDPSPCARCAGEAAIAEGGQETRQATGVAPYRPRLEDDRCMAMQADRVPRALVVAAAAVAAGLGLGAASREPFTFAFTNVARQAGLHGVTVYGGRDSNRYLLETTGSGVALIDVDADGWLDVFVVNGTTLEGFAAGDEPTA